jgi:predicted kinase
MDVSRQGTLIVMVGLPASGKTTLARRFQAERGALRLTPDEWMKPLFDDSEADGKRDVLEGRFVWLALDALRAGIDVVLDFGVWCRDERSALRALAADAGARWQLVYLAVTIDEQLDRIRRRTALDLSNSFDLSESELRHFAAFFEEPDIDELESSTIPDPPAGSSSWREWACQRWPTSEG